MISNLPDKEFKVMIEKMLTELGRKMEEHSKNFNKKLEIKNEKQLELKNKITKKRKEICTRGNQYLLDATEEWINHLEDRLEKHHPFRTTTTTKFKNIRRV